MFRPLFSQKIIKNMRVLEEAVCNEKHGTIVE
jgi:hypothetical protein